MRRYRPYRAAFCPKRKLVFAVLTLLVCADRSQGQQQFPPLRDPSPPVSEAPLAGQSSESQELESIELGPMDEQGPMEPAASETLPVEPKTHGDLPPPQLTWWHDRVTRSVLDRPQWVKFDLETILLDTLRSSPLIHGVSQRTSIALEKIVQQDAAFDSNLLFESEYGRVNDPVGNSLTTGGPPRLLEDSVVSRAGLQRSGRRGTKFNLSQELGLLDSNSNFFDPEQQGNSRLSLSLSQPLLARGGQVYNERLLTQARIAGDVSWQDMQTDVERRIAEVVAAYWTLYEMRCHLLQQEALLRRGERIQAIVEARAGFDSGRIELAKVRQRVARRLDGQLHVGAEVKKQQVRLARLVGSDELAGVEQPLELIPLESPDFPDIELDLRDAVLQGIENRPEIRSATAALESAALSIDVTRAELAPELTAVVDTYLSGLNGNYRVVDSFTDQFTRGGPGITAGLRFDLPIGRRAAKSRYREAHHLYQQRSQELRETIQLARAEIESSLVDVNTAMAQQRTKRRLLVTAMDEEEILTRRWELIGGDGAAVGTILENLLDAQQRRTEAEREWVSAQSRYLTSLVALQRAMGTLLIRIGIQPVQRGQDKTIEFIHPAAKQTKDAAQPLTDPQTVESSSGSQSDDEPNDSKSPVGFLRPFSLLWK
jgi:outer membrane protein TolC